MDIVKVSIMGICGMMLGFILKETRPEFAALVTMMTGFLILGLASRLFCFIPSFIMSVFMCQYFKRL